MVPVFVSGQYREIRNVRISVEEGLDARFVNSMIQDQKGYIWLGSSSGLIRYDGYRFENYNQHLNCANCDSVQPGTISALLLDESGMIWIQSENHIFLFDPEREQSLRLTGIHENRTEELTFFRRKNPGMIIDRDGAIWAAGNTGLIRIIVSQDLQKSVTDRTSVQDVRELVEIEYIRISDEVVSRKNVVQTICEDRAGNVWVGCLDGLYMKRAGSDQFARFIPWDGTGSEVTREIFDLIDVDGNTLLIAAEGGLFELKHVRQHDDPAAGYTSDVSIKLLYQESRKAIHTMFRAGNGDIIVGTTLDLLRLRRQGGSGEYVISSLYRGLKDPEETGYDISIRTILQDRTGVLWVAQSYDGLRKLNLDSTPFITFEETVARHFENTDINPICEDQEGHLWIGTYGAGIYRLDVNTGQVDNFNPGTPKTDIICMTEIEPGRFWVGLYNGLLELDAVTGEFHDPLPAGVTEDNIRTAPVWDIIKSGNQITVSTMLGLFVYDDENRTLHQFTFDADHANAPSVDNWFGTLEQSRDGQIWATHAEKGLCRVDYNVREGSLSVVPFEPLESEEFESLIIPEIHEDASGSFWMGSGRTIYQINRSTGEINNYYIDTLLQKNSPNMIRSLLADDRGNLWMGTLQGLCRFNTESGKVHLFDRSDGLPIMFHGNNSAFKRADGTMLFGGIGGFYSFHPDSVKINDQVPEIVITDFRLFNESVHASGKGKGEMNKAISYADSVELKYDQNDISFEFAALDYTEPGKNRYAYILENYQGQWIETDAGNRVATYTNLTPGTYVFRVRGSNNHGLWNMEGTSLTILVHPPWWKTTIAYALYGILALLLFVSGIFWRTNRLSKEKRRLQLEVDRQTSEIKEANRMLEESNRTISELDQQKTRFFNNVSHEFRTLITLIKGPVEHLLDAGDKNRNNLQHLRVLRRNTDRLMVLINQLLDISRIDKGAMKLTLSETSVFEFLHTIAASYSAMAERKGIRYLYHLSSLESRQWMDHDKVDKIISNLLSNAFKFTGEGGKVEMETMLEYADPGSDPVLIVSVSDTGSGIPPEVQEKIFDRFYQAEAQVKKAQEGTGIGLALASDLVKLMHGRIEVESQVHMGSTFTAHIPLGKKHLKESEYIIDNQTDIPVTEMIDTHEPEGTETEPDILATTHDQEFGRRSKVLLVEDNRDLRWLVASQIESEYEVLEAVDGSAGLKIALEKMPDLVITDLMMPRMDGMELCRRLKHDIRTSHIPVLMLTAKTSLEDKLSGLEDGADDYIVKPFDAREVSIRIRNLLEQRRKLKEKFSREMTLEPSDVVVTPADQKFLEKAIKIIDSQMSSEQFGVRKLCEEMHMSRSTLFRKLDALTGQSPVEFIRSMRLKRAASLLKQQYGNVSEVALEVGFSNPSYFTRMFREAYHFSPQEYVRSLKSQRADR